MKIEPKLMTDVELADFALTVASAFESQSLAGLEMNYDAMANAGPAVLGHIAALQEQVATEKALALQWYQACANGIDTALEHRAREIAALAAERDAMADFARIACDDRDAHAARCVELQRQFTEMEIERDCYRENYRALAQAYQKTQVT